MKKSVSIVCVLLLLSLSMMGQKQSNQNPEMTVSSLSYGGDFKEETFISKIILPEIEIKENRRFNPKKGKTVVVQQLAYNNISADDALESFVADIKDAGNNAFYNLKISPAIKHLKSGKKITAVSGYRIEGVALVL